VRADASLRVVELEARIQVRATAICSSVNWLASPSTSIGLVGGTPLLDIELKVEVENALRYQM